MTHTLQTDIKQRGRLQGIIWTQNSMRKLHIHHANHQKYGCCRDESHSRRLLDYMHLDNNMAFLLTLMFFPAFPRASNIRHLDKLYLNKVHVMGPSALVAKLPKNTTSVVVIGSGILLLQTTNWSPSHAFQWIWMCRIQFPVLSSLVDMFQFTLYRNPLLSHSNCFWYIPVQCGYWLMLGSCHGCCWMASAGRSACVLLLL